MLHRRVGAIRKICLFIEPTLVNSQLHLLPAFTQMSRFFISLVGGIKWAELQYISRVLTQLSSSNFSGTLESPQSDRRCRYEEWSTACNALVNF